MEGISASSAARVSHRQTAAPTRQSSRSGTPCSIAAVASTVAIGSASALTYMAARAVGLFISDSPAPSSEKEKSLVPFEKMSPDSGALSPSLRSGVLRASAVDRLLARQLKINSARHLTSASTAEKYGTNLVKDWSGDDIPFTIHGWQLGSGSWSKQAINSGGDNGLWSFYTSSANAELFQDVPLTDYATDIASGKASYMAEGLIVANSIDARMKIEFVTSDQIVLDTITKSGTQKFELLGKVPFGTTAVRIRLQTYGTGYGPWARFDTVRFVVKTTVPSATIKAGELLDVVVPESAMGGHSDIEMVMTAASGSTIPSGLRFVDGRRLQWRTDSGDTGTYHVKLSEADKRSGTQLLSQDMDITVLPSDGTVCEIDTLSTGLTFSTNLIQNPSADLTPITLIGWEITSGTWERSTTGAASGMAFLTRSGYAEMSQNTDVCSHSDLIETGKQYVLLGGSLSKNSAQAMFQWDCYDSAGNHIRTFKTGDTSGAVRHIQAIPMGTTTIKTRLQTKDMGYGPWVSFDDVHIKLLAPMPTLKLEAGTAFAYNIPGQVYGFDTSLSSVLSMADGSSLPDGLTYNPLLRQITWTPTASQIKSYDFKLRITTGSTDYPVYFSANVYSTLPSGICDIQLSFNQVPENVASGTIIGSLSAKGDVDGKTLTYALVSGLGDTDNAKFQIEGSTLKAIGAFDYEETPTASIRVKVSSDTDDYEKIMPLSLTNVNEPPIAIFLSPAAAVPENLRVGDAIATLSSTDPDAGDTHTYTLIPGLDSAFFSISGNALKLAQGLDFETKSSYQIQVQTTDAGGLSKISTLTITVVDVNEAPTIVRLINPSTVVEGVSDARVGELEGIDPDAGDSVTFSIVPGFDGSSFRITNGNILRTTIAFDADTQPTAKLTIRATDSSGLFKDETLTISIANINEPPFDIALDSYTVQEARSIGTRVATLTSSDEDSGDTHSYTIVPGANPADAAAFMISGNALLTNQVLDAETQTRYSFRIRTQDAGGLAFEKPVTIDVLGIPDEPPTAIQLDRLVIAEAMPTGTLVGRFSTTDADTVDSFTYSLVPGAGATHNAQFQIVGNQLQTAQVLDVDLGPATRSIRVRTTDSGGYTYDSIFQITVTPVNEAPISLSLRTSEISEHAEAGTFVGIFDVDDPETEDTHTFELVSGAGSEGNRHFSISGNTLVTSPTFALNKEVTPSTSIRVRVRDNAGASYETTLGITVLDAPDTPTGFAITQDKLVRTAGPGTVVGRLSGIDEDVDETFTFSLVETGKYPASEFFKIEGSSLILQQSIPSDFGDTLPIRIRVVDKDGLSFERIQTIQLKDPEPSPEARPSDESINVTVIAGSATGGIVFLCMTGALCETWRRKLRRDRGEANSNCLCWRETESLDIQTSADGSTRIRHTYTSSGFSGSHNTGPAARRNASVREHTPDPSGSRYRTDATASSGAAASASWSKNSRSILPTNTPYPSAPPADEAASIASFSAIKEQDRLDAMKRAHEEKKIAEAMRRSEQEIKKNMEKAAEEKSKNKA